MGRSTPGSISRKRRHLQLIKDMKEKHRQLLERVEHLESKVEELEQLSGCPARLTELGDQLNRVKCWIKRYFSQKGLMFLHLHVGHHDLAADLDTEPDRYALNWMNNVRLQERPRSSDEAADSNGAMEEDRCTSDSEVSESDKASEIGSRDSVG